MYKINLQYNLIFLVKYNMQHYLQYSKILITIYQNVSCAVLYELKFKNTE